MSAKSLKQLKDEWKALVEAEDLKGAGSGSGEGAAHDGEGGAAKAYGGETVKGVEGDGVQEDGTPRRFDPSNGENDLSGNTKSVDRNAGATAGRAESGDGDETGQDGAVEGANPVPRAEGGPKEWVGGVGAIGQFKNRVREVLGLPLNDKKNQGNSGLNKTGRGDDIKQNIGV